jgi:DinB superfamily
VTDESPFSNPRASARENAPMVIRALLDVLGDLPPLDVLAETPRWLEARLHGLSPDRLRAPEQPGKWSVAAVLAHLADAELVIGVRARFIVGDDQPTLIGFDQDRWAVEFRYAEADPFSALATFTSIRAANLRLWHALAPEQWQRIGHHTERGPMSAVLNLKLTAGHDLVHRRQVERILTR